MISTEVRLALGAALIVFGGSGVAAAPPLSANDWLSGGEAPPALSTWRPGDAIPADAARARDAGRRPPQAPASWRSAPGDTAIGVTRLEAPDPDRAGLLSAAAAGLPPDLWTGATAAEAAAAIAASDPRLPASHRLLRRLLLAQLDPPEGSAGDLFLARVDRLMALGAVDAAARLLDAAGAEGAEATRRRIDAALLLGQEDQACAAIDAAPGAALDLGFRIYCLARAGDWDAAALALTGAGAMGALDPGLAARLTAFLDDAAVDEGVEPPQPEAMTPLDYRLLAAIGQPVPTAPLPLAFAWADLGHDSGWKARVDAAERLARAGSLSPARLRTIYAEEPPAASGGVWDRVAAVQALDAGLRAEDADAVAATLPAATTAMAAAGLTAALGEMFATDLARMPLPPEVAALALDLSLTAADALPPQAWEGLPAPADPVRAWHLALARGEAVTAADAPPGGLEGALAAALSGETRALAEGRPAGLLLLDAMADADAGLEGDEVRAARGIATLRALGFEREARGAALQLMLLRRQRGAVLP